MDKEQLVRSLSLKTLGEVTQGEQITFSTLHKCRMRRATEKVEYEVNFRVRNAKVKASHPMKLDDDLNPVDTANELLDEIKINIR